MYKFEKYIIARKKEFKNFIIILNISLAICQKFTVYNFEVLKLDIVNH